MVGFLFLPSLHLPTHGPPLPTLTTRVVNPSVISLLTLVLDFSGDEWCSTLALSLMGCFSGPLETSIWEHTSNSPGMSMGMYKGKVSVRAGHVQAL